MRNRVALFIAALSFFPNLIMTIIIFYPNLASGQIDIFSFWTPVIVWLVLLAAFSTLLGHYYSKELLAPLIDVSRQIDDIQHDSAGIVGARLELGQHEPIETYRLKKSFNSLIAKITKEQIQRGNFIASLIHDLKTPLIASGHLLDIIRDSDDLKKDLRLNLVSEMKKENTNMISLIQKMVDAHRFERGEIKLNFKEQALEDLAENTLDRLRAMAENRNIAVSVRGRARARVDKSEFERALYNIISNAIRYASSKIEIIISENKIQIADDGPGLPAGLQELVQPFKSQSITIDGKAFNAGSAGLGLFIANKIIEAHNAVLKEKTAHKGTIIEIIFQGEPNEK